MAVLRFSDGKQIQCSADTGVKLWQILNGEREPDNDKELAVAERIDKIYLNWRNAPDDYIKERFAIIAPMVISNWMVEGNPTGNHQHTSIGLPTRPRPDDAFLIAFCTKWGLLANGRATALAKRYM